MLRTVVSRALASRAPAAARAGGNTAWRHTRLMSTEEEPATLAAGAEGEEGEFAPSDEIKFESSEPRYMTTLTFSEAGLQAMIKKDIDREKVRPQTREFRGIRRSRLASPSPDRCTQNFTSFANKHQRLTSRPSVSRRSPRRRSSVCSGVGSRATTSPPPATPTLW